MSWDHKLQGITFQSITGRQPNSVVFSENEISSLRRERILVSGAGGSIGSEIIRFLSKIEGLQFLATDRDEGSLHSLSLELDSRALFDSPHISLMDVRDYEGIKNVISDFNPTCVIHAAALKHLNALQKQPREALLTNVFGTANLIENCVQLGVKKFINISTDKAANPRSVLGESKRLAEIYTAYHRLSGWSEYTSCRFGNVFNSRGSVIETFIHQITSKSPITLTHPMIERYFMSVQEAAFLTLKTSLITAGDIHIFDMGFPVPLSLIIENIQRVLNIRTSVVITGLREGEKLNEDLFGFHEDVFDTAESRIRCANFVQDTTFDQSFIELIVNRDASRILRSWSN